jgi:hypothetical protein
MDFLINLTVPDEPSVHAVLFQKTLKKIAKKSALRR